jgi:hypothetical protein
MGQDRKPEAGKYKYNDTEHPIWIVDRRTCSLVCFVLRCGPKRYLTPQLLRFSFVLDRIVHLPVPSESFSRRGKKVSKSMNRKVNRFCSAQRLTLQGSRRFRSTCKARCVEVVANRVTLELMPWFPNGRASAAIVQRFCQCSGKGFAADRTACGQIERRFRGLINRPSHGAKFPARRR